MDKNIVVFCAHSDDEAVGIGGTLLKFIDEGYNIIKVVFSYGESSQPHFKKDVIIKKRLRETKKASKFLGIKEDIFLGLSDTNLSEIFKSFFVKKKGKVALSVNKKMIRQIKKIIQMYDPVKIFIPEANDPHPDHQIVNKTILKIVDKMKKKYSVYEFEVWNLKKEEKFEIYYDITPYFDKKIKYMKMFVSQWQYMFALWIPVWFRSRKYGLKINVKFAEKVYRIR